MTNFAHNCDIMSILFQKINKPRQWDYRPIYYDEEKYERQKRLEAMKKQAEAEVQADMQNKEQNNDNIEQPYHTSLHRGSFREARDNNSVRVDESKKANRRFVVILFILLAIAAVYWML